MIALNVQAKHQVLVYNPWLQGVSFNFKCS